MVSKVKFEKWAVGVEAVHAAAIRSMLALVVLLIGPGLVLGNENPPNVLLIVTDEHNIRTLGCYRDLLSPEQAEMWGPNSIVETPNLDRIAHDGVICTRAYATSPVCSPCRAAMITGLYPHQAGVSTNNQPLKAGVQTLAGLLRKDGYRTSFVGKWHLAGDGKPEWSPAVNGDFENTKYMFNRGHWKKFEEVGAKPKIAARDKRGQPSYDVDDAGPKSYATDFLTDRALEIIHEENPSPFLLVVSFPDPHGPNTVRAPYDQMYSHLRFLPPRTYAVEDMPSPKWLGGDKKHAIFRGDQMSRYFGMVKCLDDNIGRLLQALEDIGKTESTVVMVTSDHGDLCYEHDRLNKGNPYEGSARVPLLIRYPETLKASVYNEPVGTVDITPTLLGLIGSRPQIEFSGRDLSNHFQHSPQGKKEEMVFLRNSGTQAVWVAAVDSRYKLVLSVSDRPWLFDQKEDPDELLNFYQRPNTQAVTKKLALGLVEYAEKTGDPFLENPKILDSLRQCIN